MLYEDEVRDKARDILGLYSSAEAEGGVGQERTFKQLGFTSADVANLGFNALSHKPDGWYLPKDTSKVAIILETKAESVDML